MAKRILSRTTIEFMMRNQNRTIWDENAENYYALAFGVTTEKGRQRRTTEAQAPSAGEVILIPVILQIQRRM